MCIMDLIMICRWILAIAYSPLALPPPPQNSARCHVSVQHVLLQQAPPRGTDGRPRPPIRLKYDPRDVFRRCSRARPSVSICLAIAATRWWLGRKMTRRDALTADCTNSNSVVSLILVWLPVLSRTGGRAQALPHTRIGFEHEQLRSGLSFLSSSGWVRVDSIIHEFICMLISK